MNRIEKIVKEVLNERVNKVNKIQGGRTNNTYLVNTDNGKYVLRIAGKGTNKFIDRKLEKRNMESVDNLKITPKLYYFNEKNGTVISKYVENNKELEKKDLFDNNNLYNITKILKELHNSNIVFENRFDILEAIKNYKKVLADNKGVLPQLLKDTEYKFVEILDELYEKYPLELSPCHIDPKLNNFLLQKEKIYLIDWEYSGMADKYFEMVNFVLTNELDKVLEEKFIYGYFLGLSEKFNREKYLMYKIATDYLWCFWHLIKLNNNQDIEYNNFKWKERIERALYNVNILKGGI